MTSINLLEATAKWIAQDWKDDIIFPAYLENAPKESRDKIVLYYLAWTLKSGDVRKAFRASELFGIKIPGEIIEDAKKYILKNGKYGCERKYLIRNELEAFKEYGINFSKSEILNLLKLQYFKFDDLKALLEFYEETPDPVKVYLSLCEEICDSAIEQKELGKFSTGFHMLLEVPTPEKAHSLLPNVNSFYLRDGERLFRKFNEFVTSFKKKTMGDFNKKVENWLESILSFYPELLKDKKESRDLSFVLGRIVESYLKYFKFSEKTADKIGYALISNNLDISPWKALECFDVSRNKKMKRRLEIFTADWKKAQSLSQKEIENILNNALKEAEEFSKERYFLLAFRILESAQSLVERNRIQYSVNKIIEKKVKIALSTLQDFGKFPTMYHQSRTIMKDIEKLENKYISVDILEQVIKSKPFLTEEFICDFFSEFYNLFDKKFIIKTIRDLIENKSKLSGDYYIFKLLEDQKEKFSKEELESFADIFEKGKNYYYALKIHKLLDPESSRIAEQLRKKYPNSNSLESVREENKLLSMTNKRIKEILKKQEAEDKNRKIPEINEESIIEELENRELYIPNPKTPSKYEIKRKVSGTAEFKALYKFIEDIAILKTQIRDVDLDIKMPIKDKIYAIPLPSVKEEEPQREINRKKDDVLVTLDFGPKLRREARIKWSEATPLQKKVIKYYSLKEINNKNWLHTYMCYNEVPYKERSEYFFQIIEDFLKEMNVKEINDSILNKFTDDVDQEIIKVFLYHKSNPKPIYM